MNTKVVAVVGCVTALLAGAAFLVQQRGSKTATAQAAGSRLFAEANAADVSTVTLQRGGTTIKIAREGGAWVVASRDNYPALEDRVREVVRRVVDAEMLEEKTSNPELYERLGVEDATKDGAKGTLVTLAKADGTSVASVIVGNRQEAANWDSEKAATFVRPADSAKSYLVNSTFNLAMEPVDWLKREVLAFGSDRFWKVTVTHPTGDSVVIERSAPAAAPVLMNKPEGRELASEDKPRQTLEALASVSLDDVRAASGVDFANGATAVYTTYQGITFTARVAQAEGKTWVNFAAAYDKNNAAPLVEGAIAPTEETVAAIAKEASELHARLSPWAYQLPDWKVSAIRPLLADMLKPEEAGAQEQVPAGLRPPE